MEATENGQDQRAESEKALQATQDSLDQVRDILVGSQLRQQDRRFAQLEEKVAAQFAAFAQQQKQESAALEGLVKSELSAVATRVSGEVSQLADSLKRAQEESRNVARSIMEKLEQTGRTLSEEARNGLDKLASEFKSAGAALETRVAATEQQQASVGSELRTALFDQTKKIAEQSQAQRAELLAMIEKLGTELRAAKPDRATLANMFTEMAGRLQA